MKKAGLIAALLGLASFSSIFVVAGRSTRELAGLAQAGADMAADGIASSVSDDIHDRKLDEELNRARRELVDRQSQIIAFRPQLVHLEAEVRELEGSTASRKRLLAEAYPVLKAATTSAVTTVSFSSKERPISQFQDEIDELLTTQQREQRTLDMKRNALIHLNKTVAKGESAITELWSQLENSEHNIAMLRSRRQQAEIESETLNLVATATANRESVVGMMTQSIEKLESNVAKMESRNEARRVMADDTGTSHGNDVSRQWDRMEQLEAIHRESGIPSNPQIFESVTEIGNHSENVEDAEV